MILTTISRLSIRLNTTSFISSLWHPTEICAYSTQSSFKVKSEIQMPTIENKHVAFESDKNLKVTEFKSLSNYSNISFKHNNLHFQTSSKQNIEKSDKNKEDRLTHLLDLKHHIEFFLPKFFIRGTLRTHLHPNLFSINVIYENDLNGTTVTSKGIINLVAKINLYQMYYKYLYIISRLIVTRIDINEDTSELDIVFRIACLKRLKNPKFQLGSLDAMNDKVGRLLKEEGEWHDYRLVLTTNEKNLICLVRLTQMTPPERRPQPIFNWRAMRSKLGRVVKRAPLPAPVCSSLDKAANSKSALK